MRNFKQLLNKLKKRLQRPSTTDLLLLFAIFFMTATVYFFFSRKTEYLYITLRLFNHDAPEYVLDSNQTKAWYIEQVRVGKAQKSQLGETLIEIVDVYSYPNGDVYNDVYVTIKLKAVQNKITKQYVYEGSPLLIHDVKSFKIQDLLVVGEIIDLYQRERKLQKFKVAFELQPKRVGYELHNNSQALIKGVENYVAELIEEGMQIKNSRDEVLVGITKVHKSHGEAVVISNNGLSRIPYPDRTQVTIETELLAEKINNHYYYRKEEPLIVDEQIYLTFDQVTALGTITAVEAIHNE